MFARRTAQTLASATRSRIFLRTLSTLDGNPHVYVMPHPDNERTHLLSLLPTTPTTPSLSLGTTTTIPPTPESFRDNPNFHPILHSVIAEHAPADPAAQGQAAAYASSSGANLGSGGVFFSPSARRNSSRGHTSAPGGGGSEAVGGAANTQGGHGGAGRGGYIHISDERHPPDFGRIAEPEDIFGSIEVDGQGRILQGTYQPSGTYRVVTRDGVFGLSEFLREKLVERLRVEETAIQNSRV